MAPGPPSGFRGSRPAGFTLIEILVALAIVMLVAGVAFALYQGLRSSLARESVRQDVHAQADHALGTVLRDLACALRPGGSNELAMVYAPDDGGSTGSQLSFRTAGLVRNSSGPDTFIIENVQYNVEREDALERRGRLLRVSQVAVQGGERPAPQEGVLAAGVTVFELRLYDGDEWLDDWEDGRILPQAARVYLTLEHGGETVSLDGEILIACGHVISGR